MEKVADKFCFGVDVGGTTVKIGLFQTDGTIVDKWEIKTNTANHGSAVLPDIAHSLADKLKERNIEKVWWKELELVYLHPSTQMESFRILLTLDGAIKK